MATVEKMPMLEEGHRLITDELTRLKHERPEIIDAMQPADRGRSYVVLGDVFVAAGDRERGRSLLEHGLDLLVEHGNRFALEAGRKLADLLEADGDTAGALLALKRATAATTSPVLTRN